MRHIMVLLALAVSLASQAAPSWLHPSAAEYTEAIHQGYSLKNAKRPYETIEVGEFGVGAGQNLLLLSPMNCAMVQANLAAKHLRPEPTLDEVRTRCDGEVEIEYEVNTSVLGNDFAVLVEHGERQFRSVREADDDNPSVVTGFLGPHYQYISTFWIKPDAAWADKAAIKYSNGLKVSSAAIDFSKFAQDESRHRIANTVLSVHP